MIASLSWPDSIGVNLLNSGMIHVGATNCIISMNTVAIIQQYTQAYAPAYWKKIKTPANSGAPSITTRANPLTRSNTNVPGVVLLKTKRSSITNVAYVLKGS